MDKLIITLDAIEEADEYTTALVNLILENIKYYDMIDVDMSIKAFISSVFNKEYASVIRERVDEDINNARLDGWYSDEQIVDTIDLVLSIIDSKRDNDVSIRLTEYNISLVRLNRISLIIKFLQKENII